jgi:NAD(P)-dependent dehydrogenase (short-subunit alcohol dehydrogenase family)
MTFDFQGRVALVTGASAGIGAAVARGFAQAGAAVLLSDIDDARGEALARELRDSGAQAEHLRCDVADPDQVASLFSGLRDRFGRLDFLVNNAGIEGAPARTETCTLENWTRTLAINLSGTWYAMRHGIPLLEETGGGVIVNMSSIAGLKGLDGIPAYVASKHGVVGLTKTAALETATRGIRVHAICPAAIDTEMIQRFSGGDAEALAGMHAMQPVGRMGTPREVADATLFLCDDRSAFLTGVIFPVDGGVMAGG